jgi:sugar phosphate isomerase/epimerase
MYLGYNTNGLAHHRLPDAIDLVADEGYASIAITLDVAALDPFQDALSLAHEVARVRAALDRRGLRRVIETGARYLLNPRKKHDPTLMDPDPARRALRIDFLCRAIDVAKALEADAVSLWSGAAPASRDADPGLDCLVEALEPVIRHAEEKDMVLAFEPEPGMFIDTLACFSRLDERVRHPLFQLTIDLGHLHCMREGHIPTILRSWHARIANIHVEDMVPGVHEHLMFGAGTMDFPPIFRALNEMPYDRGIHVELSRHSHMAVEAVKAAATFLKPLVEPEKSAAAVVVHADSPRMPR